MEFLRNENLDAGLNALSMLISDSAYAVLDRDWDNRGACSPYSRLYLVESGEGILEAGEQRIVMRPGWVYLIPLGLKFSYSCEGKLTKLYFHINLPKPNGYDLFRGFGKIAELPLEAGMLEQMLLLYRRGSQGDLVLLKQRLYGIVGQFLASWNAALVPMEDYSHHVRDTIEYIQENLSARLDVETLAQRLFVSKSFLSGRFRKEVGVTVGRYLDDQLLMAAQWKLLRTDATVGQISAELGYCDQFYFSRRFHQLCGDTPLHYRKKIRAADHRE